MNPEKVIELSVRERLTKTGWFCFKISQPSVHSRNIKGIADLFAVKHGQSVWIEIKTNSGKQSENQIKFQENVESHGGKYIVVRSVDELKELL